VELWLATTPLTADDFHGLLKDAAAGERKGWLVSTQIMQLMRKMTALTQVGGNCMCRVRVCKCRCAGSTERTDHL
jgi:hypothetical protein